MKCGNVSIRLTWQSGSQVVACSIDDPVSWLMMGDHEGEAEEPPNAPSAVDRGHASSSLAAEKVARLAARLAIGRSSPVPCGGGCHESV